MRKIGELDQTFPPSHRLRHEDDFRRVYHRRQRVSDSVLLVYGCENDLAVCRLGLSVSRRVGPAHFRNRWKRLIREAFRRIQHDSKDGFDFVVIPRAGIQPDLKTTQDSLAALTKRLQRKLNKKQR